MDFLLGPLVSKDDEACFPMSGKGGRLVQVCDGIQRDGELTSLARCRIEDSLGLWWGMESGGCEGAESGRRA